MTEHKPTHVVTTPNKRPPTQIDVLKADFVRDGYKQILNYYGGNEQEANRFMTGAIEYIRRVPKLLECDRASLLMAFVQSAQFRFMPSGVSGEAYVIPYGREAKFQLGYQGIVTLLYRNVNVRGISSNIVYENDDFDYEEGLEPHLIHKPAAFGKARGEAIGVYTVAQLAGGAKTFKVMGRDAVMGIKDLSKAKDTKDSPWNSKLDPEKWMWRKTCLIQHAKLLPKTQELQQAIEIDYEGEGLDRPRLDPGAAAAAPSYHGPQEDLMKCGHPKSALSEDGVDCLACLDAASSGSGAEIQ